MRKCGKRKLTFFFFKKKKKKEEEKTDLLVITKLNFGIGGLILWRIAYRVLFVLL